MANLFDASMMYVSTTRRPSGKVVRSIAGFKDKIISRSVAEDTKHWSRIADNVLSIESYVWFITIFKALWAVMAISTGHSFLLDSQLPEFFSHRLFFGKHFDISWPLQRSTDGRMDERTDGRIDRNFDRMRQRRGIGIGIFIGAVCNFGN